MYQNIIRFDVGVHDSHLLEMAKSKEELMRVRADSLQIKTNILSKSFDDLSQIHAG